MDLYYYLIYLKDIWTDCCFHYNRSKWDPSPVFFSACPSTRSVLIPCKNHDLRPVWVAAAAAAGVFCCCCCCCNSWTLFPPQSFGQSSLFQFIGSRSRLHVRLLLKAVAAAAITVLSNGCSWEPAAILWTMFYSCFLRTSFPLTWAWLTWPSTGDLTSRLTQSPHRTDTYSKCTGKEKISLEFSRLRIALKMF